MNKNLASVQEVISIEPHPNADKLEFATVLGYRCIVPKDTYKVGDRVVFIMPDSCLPSDHHALEPFLKNCGKSGRIRAIKLRGEWSMGLIIEKTCSDIGTDLTKVYRIRKYEQPLPSNIEALGGLPYWLPKTDEEQWQSVVDVINKKLGNPVTVTLKMDGTSATFFTDVVIRAYPEEIAERGYMYNSEFVPGSSSFELAKETLLHAGITSRSLTINAFPENSTNLYIEIERKYDILRKLLGYSRRHGVFPAVRGEITGRGIQGSKNNPHSDGPLDFHVFSVFLKGFGYQAPHDPHGSINLARELGLKHVHLIGSELGSPIELTHDLISLFDSKISEFNGKPFEGVVIRDEDGFSFKVINKHYDAAK